MAPNIEDLAIDGPHGDKIGPSVTFTSLPSVTTLRLNASNEGKILTLVPRLELANTQTVEIRHWCFEGLSKSAMKQLLQGITRFPSVNRLCWYFQPSSIIKAAQAILLILLDPAIVPGLKTVDFILDAELDPNLTTDPKKLWSEERRAKIGHALGALARRREHISVGIPECLLPPSERGNVCGADESRDIDLEEYFQRDNIRMDEVDAREITATAMARWLKNHFALGL
ncbi:hypothetical protein DL93DRAFT_2082829 [Clavulina sp. PMI_390]|nr:hypothetical protein DL93DRAFT_2082829 [Clavulina sp. PMI_390]